MSVSLKVLLCICCLFGLIQSQQILRSVSQQENEVNLQVALDTACDEISAISTVDYSDLAIIKKHASIVQRATTKQKNNVKLVVSKLQNDYFWKQLKEEDQKEILLFYENVDQVSKDLTFLAHGTSKFYAKQMAENDRFIVDVGELIYSVNDMIKYKTKEQLEDIIDTISDFKTSVKNAQNDISTLLDKYDRLRSRTQQYINQKQLKLNPEIFKKYKENVNVRAIDGVSTIQHVMFWVSIFGSFAMGPPGYIFLIFNQILLNEYENSDEKKRLDDEQKQLYDIIADNVEDSSMALQKCMDIMSSAQSRLQGIEQEMEVTVGKLKQITRKYNKFGKYDEFREGAASSLLGKLNGIKRLFEIRRKEQVQQYKIDL